MTSIGRPGKIIAVHLNYRSRAAQRGRRPGSSRRTSSSRRRRWPASGDALERPGGHRAARRSRARSRWSSAAPPAASRPRTAGRTSAASPPPTTSALYDLRYADKGSQPALQGRRRLHPARPGAAARRGRRPGRAAAAHLAQRRARPGRHHRRPAVRLRPAGRRPLPADHPRARRRHPHRHPRRARRSPCPATSSRSRSSTVDGARAPAGWSPRSSTGTVPLGPCGALAHVSTTQQRADACGTARAASFDPDRRSCAERLGSGRHRNAVRRSCASAGSTTSSIDGVTRPGPARRLAGRARTLRYVPYREDLFAQHGGGYNAQKRAIDGARPRRRAGHGGPRRTRHRAPSATSSRCGPRCAAPPGSSPTAASATPPRWPRSDCPSTTPGRTPRCSAAGTCRGTSTSTIACGGATVQPGDVIVGDDDGVLVIPPDLVEEVVDGGDRAGAAGDVHRRAGRRGRARRRALPDGRALAREVRRMAREAVNGAAIEQGRSDRLRAGSRPADRATAPTPRATGWCSARSPRSWASAWSRSARRSGCWRPRAW